VPTLVALRIKRSPHSQASFLRYFFHLRRFVVTEVCLPLYYAVAQRSPPPPSPPSHRLGESLPRLLVCMRRFVRWLQLPTKCCSQVHNISTYTVTRMGVLNSTKNVTLCPGDERDSLFDRHQLHTLQLQYDLKLTAKATVTLAVPSLHGVLYVFKPFSNQNFKNLIPETTTFLIRKQVTVLAQIRVARRFAFVVDLQLKRTRKRPSDSFHLILFRLQCNACRVFVQFLTIHSINCSLGAHVRRGVA